MNASKYYATILWFKSWQGIHVASGYCNSINLPALVHCLDSMVPEHGPTSTAVVIVYLESHIETIINIVY